VLDEAGVLMDDRKGDPIGPMIVDLCRAHLDLALARAAPPDEAAGHVDRARQRLALAAAGPNTADLRQARRTLAGALSRA
jgi:hypothetical protein